MWPRPVPTTPPAGVRRGELTDLVPLAKDRLPPAPRESEGLWSREVAATFGISEATAKSRVRYALMKLAEELEPFRQEMES